MKLFGILGFLLVLSIRSNAQTTVEEWVSEGVDLHDKGEYDQAIQCYEQALKLHPNSALVNYELALSYIAKGDYKQAIEYSDVVLDQKGDFMLQAYLSKGSALDLSGQTKESIALFEKALKKAGEHYLLRYNLALNYYKSHDLKNAEHHALKAIEQNPGHASSHLILTVIHSDWKNTVQTVMAAHFFLFLEPNTKRSGDVYPILMETFSGQVSSDPNDPNTVTISVSGDTKGPFAAVELLISMLAASKTQEENKDKSEDELFQENTASFFQVLGELRDEKSDEVWWQLYAKYFSAIANSEHLETYCHYIRQSGNPSSREWLDEHPEKLEAFDGWLKDL